MERGYGYGWAIAAGACAAMAAFIAKSTSAHSHFLKQGGWRLETLGYGGVILMNLAMWTCYINSLKSQTLSALQATVINFSTNFLLCGLAGFFFFNESHSLHFQWFAGAFLIVLGTFILTKSSIGAEPASHHAKNNED